MKNIKYAFLVVLIIWAVFLLNIKLNLGLNQFGILPRSKYGLPGIVFSPFLHANQLHILSNSFPLFLLLLLTIIFYKRLALAVFFLSILLSGLLVWIFARSAIHIGASGLIYALASFLFFMGIFRRSLLSIIIAAAIAFLYGGLIWGVLPTQEYISWEGHLSGALTGIFLAYSFRNYRN